MINSEMTISERMAFIDDICLHPFALMHNCMLLDQGDAKTETLKRRLAIQRSAIEFHTLLYQSEELVFSSYWVTLELPYMSNILSQCLGLSSSADSIASVIWNVDAQSRKLSAGVEMSLMTRVPGFGVDGFVCVTGFKEILEAVIHPKDHFISLKC